jgi:glutamate-1-semialdehyde aminotransferase
VREATQAVYLGKNPRDYTNKEKLLKVMGAWHLSEDWLMIALRTSSYRKTQCGS